jgi:quaternary ammonium compound-resistance protein SugE
VGGDRSRGGRLLSPVFFDESLTPAKALWLTVIIAGVVWLKLADGPGKTERPGESRQPATNQRPETTELPERPAPA